MLMEVLNNTEEYIHSIEALETLRLEPEGFAPQRRAELDDMRRQKHNALIDSIKSTIRYISHTFCQISEKAIEKWQEDLEKRGAKMLEVKRIKLPEKVFLPDNVNFNDRYQITDWAEKIFSELSDIKNDLLSKR